MSNLVPPEYSINANDAGTITGNSLNTKKIEQLKQILIGIRRTAETGKNTLCIQTKIHIDVIDELRRGGYTIGTTPDKFRDSSTYISWNIDNSNNVIVGCLVGYGPTIERPGLSGTGSSYFDTDLGYMLWFFNGVWVNATGAEE